MPSDALFESYKRGPLHGSYDAIVIGSGIGGLAAAALLARHAGKQVLVLERHYTPGGFTHVFHRPGYEWDVGVHYIGDVGQRSLLKAVFDHLSEGELKWADMGEVYDRVVIGAEEYPFRRGAKNLQAMLKQRFPAEHQAIDAYFAEIARTLAASMPFFADKVMPGLVSKLAGPLLRRNFLEHAKRTTREVLESLTKNQQLIAVLTAQLGDYGLAPAQSSFGIHATVANHYFGGGYYPIGGSARFFDTIAPAIVRAGGKAVVNAQVEQVIVEAGRATGVRMADGCELRAPLVISDAGVTNTFGQLLPAATGERYGLPAQLQAIQPSAAHVGLYLGLAHTAAELGLPKSNYWVYPNEHHEQNLAAWMASPEAPLPLAFISFPSAKDPDFERRHPGRATIEVITVAPYAWFAKWESSRWMKRSPEYAALKQRLSAKLLDQLYRCVPQVQGKIDHCELSTPLSTRHFANYAHGEIYGLEHTPQRFAQAFLRPETPVRGLFLTGQDVLSCGVAGAMMGGVLCASAILSTSLVPTILKRARAGVR